MPVGLSRREVLSRLGAGVAALAAGCTPARLAFRLYPSAFDDPSTCERTLRAFVLAVAPGAGPGDPCLTRAFGDDLFPFRRYREVFAADLSRRARNRFGEPAFERLARHEQEAVIRGGLHGDGLTRKLYGGAVFLAQLTAVAGIYADGGSIPALDFEGEYRWDGMERVTWPDPGHYLTTATTVDGNPS